MMDRGQEPDHPRPPRCVAPGANPSGGFEAPQNGEQSGSGGHSAWQRVSAQHPCPICGKPDNCSVLAQPSWAQGAHPQWSQSQGTMVWCGRVSVGALRQNRGGQYLHRLTDNWLPPLPPPRSSPRRSAPRYEFSGLAQQLFDTGALQRGELAQRLGVTVLALEHLQVGWNPVQKYWSFPERDAQGKIIGINARHENGDKKRLKGSKAGLTYAPGWDLREGPILLVEGGSDTAALLGLNLCVVGRPSNFGGVELLSELLIDQPSDREIIVIAERDEKPDGRWPGKEGAVRTAERLSAALERNVSWSLPPDHAKDARGWLNTAPSLPTERLRALFLSGLDPVTIRPSPRYICELPRVSSASLRDWRHAMAQARLQSLTRPGLYLDRSATGTGKSHVDFTAIQSLLAQEVAA